MFALDWVVEEEGEGKLKCHLVMPRGLPSHAVKGSKPLLLFRWGECLV
jgi:hypothetical protein